MAWLVTGSAGFIGYHVAAALLHRGERVIGVDNLTPYYDLRLKRARLARLVAHRGFSYHELDLTDLAGITALFEADQEIEQIVHLAAQAGVRYSLIEPLAYVDANVKGQVVVLEAARRLRRLKGLVYASSSSVYGNSDRQPFSLADRADKPVSLYAATKRAAELITESYAQLYALPCTGLRFFTVYGAWGRPDMAYYAFTDAILAGRPIKVFNGGALARDFTYIDDVVPAVIAAAERAAPGHRIYNIGNNRPERLLDFIATLERAIGRDAVKEMAPMQPGDVESTFADIDAARRDLDFEPCTPISVGLPRFVHWHREYHTGL